MDFLYFALGTHRQLLTWRTLSTLPITTAFSRRKYFFIPFKSFACQYTPVKVPQGGDETDRLDWRHG